ncbi:MAG: 30S ribosome-binding factor [Acidimicrobiales bacterium]|nr:MAG: 30S ribosome-binding factor RbfA [Actinomycetota bacterium]MBV6509172.1 30S ribosome-binding factor [Acidimicrobiales bacterium]RIK08482.1 MAG: 30S ribosome-binding factor RbfA [Acidobacteriota bacterium]
MARRSHSGHRHYPRTARLNELLREILADELERIDDDRLDMVTVTGVEVAPDLAHATVFYSALSQKSEDRTEVVGVALDEARGRLQAAVARQARTRRVPTLEFRVDPGVEAGQRIESILGEIREAKRRGDEPDGS